MITSVDREGMKRAVDWVEKLTEDAVVGKVYDGKVTKIMDFGAFVEILPKQEGLVHISEIAPYRVDKVTDLVNMGDKVKVKVYEIDDLGRVNLSMKRALSDEETAQMKKEHEAKGGDEPSPRPPQRPRPPQL